MPSSTTAVKMINIAKAWPGVLANDRIDFELVEGEIHALLGENGAGKTTLMNILYGLYQADEGEIYIRGEKVKIRSPYDAINLGIGMVHQHPMLISRHTVAENVVLGLSSSKFFFPTKVVEGKIAEFSEKYGLRVDPEVKIWQLSAGEQQRVEIIKALYRGANIIILDEPTTMLTPAEIKELFAIICRMAKQGCSVVFITHKLEEVMAISDRITVLRHGKVVATVKPSMTSRQELTKMLIGKEVLYSLEKKPVEKGRVVLELKELCALGDKGLPALKNVSFAIHEGEILGIAGVAGNGQRELVEVITGLRKASGGKVFISNRDMTNQSPRQIIDQSVGYIPEDRLGMGIVPNLRIDENLILKSYRSMPFCKGLFLNSNVIAQHTEKLISEYDIITPSKQTPVRLLSGGNIQKLILARETSQEPCLIIAAHPTYGLDVGATERIRQLLLKRRETGMAILLVSEDLEEIVQMSDRIAVMFEGSIVGIVDAKKAESFEEIGSMMVGARK